MSYEVEYEMKIINDLRKAKQSAYEITQKKCSWWIEYFDCHGIRWIRKERPTNEGVFEFSCYRDEFCRRKDEYPQQFDGSVKITDRTLSIQKQHIEFLKQTNQF